MTDMLPVPLTRPRVQGHWPESAARVCNVNLRQILPEDARRATVRLTAPTSYCSGVLIAADLGAHSAKATAFVLTCAHFFRGLPANPVPAITVTGPGFRRTVSAVRRIRGTDIAVAKLDSPAPARALPPVTRRGAVWMQRIVTYGYGGRRTTASEKPGRALITLPLSLSRNLSTLVAPAGLVLNRPGAIKGDSGGPIFGAGEVLATQSLVLDPAGVQTPLATTSLLGSHRGALRRAIGAL